MADSYDGKRLNSPNDVVAHPDGSYWFTDPPYGGQLYEGTPDAPGGPSNPAGQIKPELGQPPGIGTHQARAADRHATASIRAARSSWWSSEDQVPDPNGLCFSPDYKKLYVVSTGRGPGDTGPGGKRDVYVFDVGADNKPTNGKRLLRLHDRRHQVRPRRHPRRRLRQRLDARATPAATLGYSGVTVWSPEGKLLGPHPAAGECAATSASAAPSATGCSWRRASRSTPSTSPRRAPGRPDAITSRAVHIETSARSWNQLWAWTKVLILGDSARGVVS